MFDLTGTTALVTGANRGLGRHLTEQLIARGATVYAAARNQAAVEAQRAVTEAQALGIVPGSTLFYDLESFSTKSSTACTSSPVS